MSKAPTEREIRIAVALTALALFFPVLMIANGKLLPSVDFAVPYTGGAILHDGNRAQLYNLVEQERVQDQFLGRPGLLLDPYPPFHALLFAPLTRLSYRTAYLVWGAINVLLWVLFYFVIRSEAGSIQPFQYLALCFLFFPVWATLMQGQISLILLLSLTLTYFYLRRRRDFAGGLALGLGLIKFQVVVPLALIFLLRRKWKLLAGLGVTAVALTVLSLIAVGPVAMVSYVNLLVDIFRHPSNPAYSRIKPWNMPTLAGLLEGFLKGRISAHWITALSGGISSCLISFTAWRWGPEDETGHDSFDLAFAAAVVVSLLTAPYLQVHDLSPALLAILLVLGSARWRAKSVERTIVTGAIAVLYALPLYLGALMGRQKLYAVAPVLLVFVAGVWILGKGGVPGDDVCGSLETPPSSVDSVAAPG